VFSLLPVFSHDKQADRRCHGRNGSNPAGPPLCFPPQQHSTTVSSSSLTLHSPCRAAHATQAVEVIGHEERVSRLTAGTAVPLESRINAAAVVEAATSVSGAVLSAVDGVIEGLVTLVDEASHARAVRVEIRALFMLCLALRPAARARIHDAEADRRRVLMDEGGEADDDAHGRRLERCVKGSEKYWRAVFFYACDPRVFLVGSLRMGEGALLKTALLLLFSCSQTNVLHAYSVGQQSARGRSTTNIVLRG
jgi:hypothetical protein